MYDMGDIGNWQQGNLCFVEGIVVCCGIGFWFGVIGFFFCVVVIGWFVEQGLDFVGFYVVFQRFGQ